MGGFGWAGWTCRRRDRLFAVDRARVAQAMETHVLAAAGADRTAYAIVGDQQAWTPRDGWTSVPVLEQDDD